MMNSLIELKPLVDVNVINETLTRIGIANKTKKILYPTCYLHENDGIFYLLHFKEILLMCRDNAYNNICEDDILRKNAIAFCLYNWKLIDIDIEKIQPYNKFVFVLPHSEKYDWKISHKINMRYMTQL